VVAFQALVDILLISILAVEMVEKASAQGISEGYRQLMRAGGDSILDNSDWGILSFGAGAVTLASILIPIEAAGSE
jgi:hypothetical protein